VAHEANEPIHTVLAKAVEAYRRRRLLEQMNAAYAVLPADGQGWREEQEERAAWDATLGDGLEDD
jgi:hypothetical protein